MVLNEILKYFQSRLDEVAYNYTLALENNDPDGVHDIRVAIKRLKAFFNLFEYINDEFIARKNFRNFRKIAKNTCGLRDSQVQLELLGKLNKKLNLNVIDFESYLKKIESENLESFRIFSKKEPIKKLDSSKKLFKKALKDISPVWAETKAHGRFYNLKNDLIILSSESDLKEEILHKVRIKSKETHYTLEIVQQCFHIFEDRTDFIKDIKKVHQVLGKWHDYDVSLVYLDNFLSGYGNNSSSETYDQLRKHITKQKVKLSNNFRTVLDEFGKTASIF